MFKNEKKGRLYGIKKKTTYVDNPPIEDTTTKITRSINFSKSNFANLGKWILIIVLFLYFGSYTINGFVASNITKDSTEEIIVHEYQKQIGTELVGGEFQVNEFSINYFNDYLFGKKIYLKNNFLNLDNDIVKTFIGETETYSMSEHSIITYYISYRIYAYDLNDNYLFDSGLNQSNIIVNGRISDYTLYLSNVRLFNSIRYNNYYLTDNYSSFDKNSLWDNVYYFKFDYQLGNSFYASVNSSYNFVDTLGLFNYIMNNYFIYSYYDEIPIYETTTYTYQVKDINYNWDYKLKQISKFRPLFNSKDLFVNEDFYKYSNLITYEFKNTTDEKKNVVDKYKNDEGLKILFDNEAISIKGREYNFHLFKEKKDYISYIYFDYSKIDMLDKNVYNSYMYALEKYVSSTTIDDYFIYSKMKFDAKDLLILMSFPLQVVINTAYNFGVLVGIVTLW